MFFNRTNNKSKSDSRSHEDSRHENRNHSSFDFHNPNRSTDNHKSNNLFDIDENDGVSEKKERKMRSLDFKRIDQFRKMHELTDDESPHHPIEKHETQAKNRGLFAEDEAALRQTSAADMMRYEQTESPTSTEIKAKARKKNKHYSPYSDYNAPQVS